MTSIIKVDKIQKSDGSVLSLSDAGMIIPYFQGKIGTATYTAQTQYNYTLNNFSTVNSAASLGGDSQTVTINTAGTWKLDLTVTCASIDNPNSRWQENYIYLNGSKILDIRDHVINIDTDYEYYTVSGSIIVNISAGDAVVARANGQYRWITDSNYGSNFSGIRLA